jgi:hypothetical protein
MKMTKQKLVRSTLTYTKYKPLFLVVVDQLHTGIE